MSPPQASTSSSSARAALSAKSHRHPTGSPVSLVGRRVLSVLRCHPESVRVTEADIARIPVANLRVPRAEFAAVWAAAEQRDASRRDRGVTDWYARGVAATCRWLAGALVRLGDRAAGAWRTPR